jgi:hypothetical protein
MKRICPALTALVLLIPALANADTIDVIDASARGFIDAVAGANGNNSTNGYVAGNPAGFEGSPPGPDRDHFDFSIPSFSGTLSGATFSLSNPAPMVLDNMSFLGGHGGGTNTFTVYSLGSYGTYGFSDIGSGTAYGNATISGNGTVTITLNSAALTAIMNDEGGTFSLGGVDSGEFTSLGYDFGNTRFPNNPTALTLDIGPATSTPEPASITLLASSCLGFGGFGLYRRRRRALTLSPVSI